MHAQGAAPEGGTSGQRLIDKGHPDSSANASHLHACGGCGVMTDDSQGICVNCRHTDRTHGTFVSGPGRACPDCGAE